MEKVKQLSEKLLEQLSRKDISSEQIIDGVSNYLLGLLDGIEASKEKENENN